MPCPTHRWPRRRHLADAARDAVRAGATHPARFARLAVLVVSLSGLDVAAADAAIARERDPVILSGSDVPSLLGVDPARIVAFRWEADWVAVPVQVDERKPEDFGIIYNDVPSGFLVRTYVDPETFTGPDTDPLYDADDEIVLRARDAGARAPGAPGPAGIVPGTGVEISLSDPLDGGTARLYLFESDGTLDPAAGVPDLAYDFVLLSGDYKLTYGTLSGPNPEDSRVTTPSYTVHFSDRWIRDETALFDGGATGVDILDRHKSAFAPGNCARTEQTFSNGEGAFLANVKGPVRAIRAYVGANSGVTTYRVHRFYEAREDVTTHLRVHPISGIVDWFDYAPAAAGMTWRNDRNPNGVPVDGVPDVVDLGAMTWDMITGAPGTLARTFLLVTDIPGFDWTTYYSDDSTPSVTQCTGDAFEYAASGPRETDPLPNTDPAVGAYFTFEPTIVVAYGPPGLDADWAAARAAEAMTPLDVFAAPYSPDPTSVASRPGTAPSLVLRPNPAVARAEVLAGGLGAGPARVRVFDVAGRQVFRGTTRTTAGAAAFDLDLRGWPPGTYFLRVECDAGTSARRRLTVVR